MQEIRLSPGIPSGSEPHHGEGSLFSCGGRRGARSGARALTGGSSGLLAGWTCVFQACSVESRGFWEGASVGKEAGVQGCKRKCPRGCQGPRGRHGEGTDASCLGCPEQ